MLRETKSRLSRIYRGPLSGKNLILLILVVMIGTINAQGITNTLGGNTAADKFIVENSDSEAGLVVTGKGNVGIGTMEPQEKLQIHGDLIVHETVESHRGANIMAADIEGNMVDLFAEDGHGYLKTTVSEMDLVFGAGFWGDHLTIKSDGKVGIGTASPSTKLDVNGTVTATAFSGALNASNISSGTLNNARFNALSDLGGGSGSTFLRKDGTWTTTPSGADNLGNHTATQDVDMAGFEVNLNGGYLSGDGDDEGLFVANNGNVGIGTTNPQSKLSVSGDGSSNSAIYGEAPGSSGYGVYGSASGSSGSGVYGYASNSGAGANYGGSFRAAGSSGSGVYGYASNSGALVTNFGGFFRAAGGSGRGVYGSASNSGATVTNFGGYFTAAGGSSRGVYGYASNSGVVSNYGGYFEAAGQFGRGVYGIAPGTQGYGVRGYASNSGALINYGGYFEAAAIAGRGVYGTAPGTEGYGVRGYASNSGATINYGGYFEAAGSSGRGVYGYATGANGKGVVGHGNVAVTSYDFDAVGPGVNYGSTSSIRWKTNIVEIDNPLEKLAELRGVYFNWDEEHGGHHDVGMIAEEVGKVLPEIVVYEENGIDADGMDYSKLTPLLVEAVNAQQKLIEELQAEIEILKRR